MIKILIENSECKIENLEDKYILKEIYRKLCVKQKGYRFSPAFKKGHWNGDVPFFNDKKKTFPTGLLFMVEEVLEECELEYEKEDLRETLNISVPEEIDLLEPNIPEGFITLREYQYESVRQAFEQKRGIINVATNGGKTEIACGIMKLLLPVLGDRKILFVTHNQEIFNQTAKRIEKRLDIKVGKVGNGEWDVRPITVVMIPTISKYIKPPKIDIKYTGEAKVIKYFLDEIKGAHNIDKEGLKRLIVRFQRRKDSTCQKVAEMLTGYLDIAGTSKMEKEIRKMKKFLTKYEAKKQGKERAKYDRAIELLESCLCFIGDEFHHTTSRTWYDTLNLCTNAIYRFGLTGTVDKEDEVLYMRLLACSGQILHKVSNEYLIGMGFSAKPTIYLSDVNEPFIPDNLQWADIYKHGIVENKARNELIAKQVCEEYNNGKVCLLITNHIEHGENIKSILDSMGVESEFTNGQLGSDTRENLLESLKDGTLKVLIATSILDEGVDVPNLNTVFLCGGGKSLRQVLQRVGRGLRKKSDGSGLAVYDYVDYQHPILTRHSLKRLQIYDAENFDIERL